MQELSVEQMKLVSGGVDIPRVTIDGSANGWGSAATSAGFGSYSSPNIGGGGGGGVVSTVVKKAVEIVATYAAEKALDAAVDKVTEPEKPDPAKAAQEAAAAAAARDAQARADAAERAREEASDRQAARNHANKSK